MLTLICPSLYRSSMICGGDLSIGQGNVSSPNATTDTPQETTALACIWKASEDGVEVGTVHEANSTLIVTIHNLRIPSSGEKTVYCNDGVLKIGTPAYSVHYYAQKYCGSMTNQKLYFPGDSLEVQYLTADFNSTFSLSYRTVLCGGNVNNAYQGNITSLNYPSPYPVNTECIWVVDFPADWGSSYGIKVKFFDMDLDDHVGTDGNCDRDFLVIRNGKYQTSPVLGKFCGSSIPNEITSMANHLWIEFHSDENSDGGRRGFSIGLEEGSGSTCGGEVHSKLGRLGTPGQGGGSSRYPNNAECEWNIATVPGYTINLVFHYRFDIENSTNCTNDHVEIFSTDGSSWKSLGRFCGRQLPPSINTTSTIIKVVFKSNQNVNGDGFQLYWYSVCGGIFEQPTGVIRSAHYDMVEHNYNINPGAYWDWIGWENSWDVYRCDYMVKGQADDYIMLRFREPFEVKTKTWVDPAEMRTACPYANVTVWQGNTTNIRRRTRPACGTQVPPPFVSRGPAVISYNYRPADQVYGFTVEYNKFECGGEITAPKVIRSPGHPFTSSANMNCTWVATAPQNKVVRFKFKFLEMEYHPSCRYDYVKLYDGPRIEATKLIGTFCGNLTKDYPNISSRSGIMTIQSITDHSIQHGGFEAAVDFTLGESQGCGGTKNVTEAPVTLTSLDAAGNGTSLDCQWLLIAPEFKSIQISFNSFSSSTQGLNVLTNETCLYNFVEIRDGPGPFGQLLGKLCGNSLPPRIISSQNFIWIRFYTDGSSNYLRFSLAATSRDTPCGPLVLNATSTLQYLQSPGYPSNYENNVRCRWRIDAAGRYDKVDITFVEMDIEASSDCRKDRLEIRDAFVEEGTVGPVTFSGSEVPYTNSNLNDIKYCGSQTPPDFFTYRRSAELVFHADENGNRKGFKISYKIAGCNRTFENTQGRIFSPGWPGYAPRYSNCLSTIRARNGTQIALYFNTFKLPVSTPGALTCTDSALEVRDSTLSGPILASYCGETIPNPVFSNTSVLYVKFFSRFQLANGFDITYTSTEMGKGCGGEIFNTEGSFTSPLYPSSYSVNSDCRWTIRVPGGQRIQIEFSNFMFAGDCQTDFLEILSKDSHDSNGSPVLFSRYCSGDAPATYTGSTDMAVVRYKTSVNNTGSGWRATFKGVLPTNVPVDSS